MTLATDQPVNIRHPARVRAKEAELLEVLRQSPEGLRSPQIRKMTGENCSACLPPLAGAIADRLHRLLRRGEVERVGRLWRLPQGDDGDDEQSSWRCPNRLRGSEPVGEADRQLRKTRHVRIRLPPIRVTPPLRQGGGGRAPRRPSPARTGEVCMETGECARPTRRSAPAKLARGAFRVHTHARARSTSGFLRG